MKRGKKFLGVIGCIVLAALLVLIGSHYLAVESEENVSLKQRANSAQTEDVTASSSAVSGTSADGSASSDESQNADTSTAAESAATDTQTTEVRAISCRGDAFMTASQSGTVTYPQALQSILQQEGKTNEVMDYTWDMAGSLSQLYLAGIPESQLNTYIEKHRQSGTDLSATELQLRTDRAQKDLTRNDQAAIPVICMGYAGGWGNDLDELVEQIQLILSTYSNQQDYVVMGITPEGWTDSTSYDSALSTAFGDHYLSLNSVLTNPAMSDAGRTEIAQALANKLTELGLI